MPTTTTYFPSPLGDLRLTASESALTEVLFPKEGVSTRLPVYPSTHSVLSLAAAQLTEYFAGTRTTFDLPLEPSGTDFQRSVWKALRAIPYGTTLSYGELARRLGDPRATRAVGAANGQNPIPIIVPCHRVIGSRGELTGFGGGIDRKRWLLNHECSPLSPLAPL